MANEKVEWLTLSQAAGLLGVHPSTVRLWADKGWIPVHRTQGKHRRFVRSEIELWVGTSHPSRALEPENVVQQALHQIRFQVGEGRLEAEEWYQRLDAEARSRYRQSGRTLVLGLVKYISAEDNIGEEEARALGYEYASLGRRYKLDSLEATRAFLFFRNTLLESMIAVYQAARIPSGAAWGELLDKLFNFTDLILLSLLETYSLFEHKHA